MVSLQSIDIHEDLAPPLAHHNDSGREDSQLLHHLQLFNAWFLQYRVELGNNRYMNMAQQGEDMATSRPAVDTKFVLQADDVCVSKIKEVGSTAIAG